MILIGMLDTLTYEYDGSIPAGIEMSVSAQDYNYQPSAGKEVLRAGELAVANTSKRGSGMKQDLPEK